MAQTALFGCTGRLGTAILQRLGEGILHPPEDELDLTDTSTVRNLLLEHRPATIINAAAYTDVDGAEENAEAAHRINAELVADLCSLSAEIGALFVHFSTDFVFDGTKGAPYAEEDVPAPLSVYAESKLAGEEAVLSLLPEDRYLLIRASWLFAPWGPSFPASVLGWASKGTLKAPSDVVGTPTYAPDLADAVVGLLDREARGLYHVANAGIASRWDLARKTVEVAGLDIEVEEASASDFPAPAPRPLNSALSCEKYVTCAGAPLPRWDDAVGRWYGARAESA
jgi:dTDP-4-dehydrorhamnose reductase